MSFQKDMMSCISSRLVLFYIEYESLIISHYIQLAEYFRADTFLLLNLYHLHYQPQLIKLKLSKNMKPG